MGDTAPGKVANVNGIAASQHHSITASRHRRYGPSVVFRVLLSPQDTAQHPASNPLQRQRVVTRRCRRRLVSAGIAGDGLKTKLVGAIGADGGLWYAYAQIAFSRTHISRWYCRLDDGQHRRQHKHFVRENLPRPVQIATVAAVGTIAYQPPPQVSDLSGGRLTVDSLWACPPAVSAIGDLEIASLKCKGWRWLCAT